ncbi:MAG: WecB/TagA/CpsF family glycosyltransferase [Myxococcaceae bacterium]|nr:WecB/TagA/CpsF family glycosyltransferase [Myxococcaceae bacterium]
MAQPQRRLVIGQVPIDVITFDGALDAIEALVEAKAGGYVVTPNIDHVVLAESNTAFRDAYQGAALSLVDGQPLVWVSKQVGERLPDKISGSDLIWPLLERAAKKQWRVYFLGAGPGVAEKAAQVVRERYGTNVVGCDSPMVPKDAQPEAMKAVFDKLKAAKPDVVLFALGAPKQEVLMHRCMALYAPAVGLGIGAGLDFIAGTVARAPVWMQRAGLEWAYRLSREPKRLWRRYLVDDPKFLVILARTLRRPMGERVTER